MENYFSKIMVDIATLVSITLGFGSFVPNFHFVLDLQHGHSLATLRVDKKIVEIPVIRQ